MLQPSKKVSPSRKPAPNVSSLPAPTDTQTSGGEEQSIVQLMGDALKFHKPG